MGYEFYITGHSPDSGTYGQEHELTLTGTLMSNIYTIYLIDSSNVKTALDTISQSSTQMVLRVPSNLPVGDYHVGAKGKVTDIPPDSIVVSTWIYKCVIQWEADSIYPSIGTINDSQLCKITGSNLTNVSTITINNTSCTIVTQEDTLLYFYTPDNLDVDTYDVTITASDGTTKTLSYSVLDYIVGQPLNMNDMNYEDLPYWEESCKLQDDGKYEDAYKLLLGHDVDFINKDVINPLYKRLYNVQNYLQNKYSKERITAYKDKPTEKTKNMIFVSDKESI